MRLYTKFSEALDAEISDLRIIEEAVDGTRSANNGEVTAQLKQLTTRLLQSRRWDRLHVANQQVESGD